MRVSSRAVKVCQNKQITEKIRTRESKYRNAQYEKRVPSCDICELTLQTFRACCKVSICHERKLKKYQNFVVHVFETKQVP